MLNAVSVESARTGMQARAHVSITLGISWQLEPGGEGAAHLAAFLASLPSRGQEIDGKLQSNSR
jgi:hypothetical protein